MLAILGLLGAGIAANQFSDRGTQQPKRETQHAKKAQDVDPTAFRQPQPMTIRQAHGFDRRMRVDQLHPEGLGLNLRVGPQSAKSNLWANNGITPVLQDYHVVDLSDVKALERGVQRMPTRARGIPNPGLDHPNIPHAKLAALRSNITMEPGVAEVHYIGDKRRMPIPMDFDRTTELGPFHYPYEIYRPDAMTTVDRRMVGASKLYYPPKTRIPHMELIAQDQAETAAHNKNGFPYKSPCASGNSPQWVAAGKTGTCDNCYCSLPGDKGQKKIPNEFCAAAGPQPSGGPPTGNVCTKTPLYPHPQHNPKNPSHEAEYVVLAVAGLAGVFILYRVLS